MTATPREAVGQAYDPALMLRARERSWAVLQGIRERMRPGISEDEARAEAAEVFRAHGLERLWHPVVIRIGANTTLSFRERSNPDLRLGEDDIYFIDLGLVFEGHEGDVGDTFTTGADPARQACAEAARTLFDEVAAAWRTRGLSGEALYAFARRSDDIADSPEPLDDRRRRLAQWREELRYTGEHTATGAAIYEMSCVAPVRRLSTARIAVSIEGSELL